MESLIDDIIENLGFIILIIGGLISFFNRSKEEEKPSSKQPPKKLLFPPLEDLVGKENDHEKKSTSEPMTSKIEAATANVEFAEENETNSISEQQFVTTNEVSFQEKKREKKKPHYLTSNKKKVIDGVIWSEVIGPPRARKKHQYSYFKRG